MSGRTHYVDAEYPAVPVIDGDGSMPDDGTAVVVWDDDPDTGSLWIDWAHHGPIDLRPVQQCDAAHDGHDCTERGACTRALLALCERVTARTQLPREERQTDDR